MRGLFVLRWLLRTFALLQPFVVMNGPNGPSSSRLAMNVDNTVSAESTSNITMSDSAESTSNSTMSDSDGIEEEEEEEEEEQDQPQAAAHQEDEQEEPQAAEQEQPLPAAAFDDEVMEVEEEEEDDVWGLIMADWREEAEFLKAILEQALEEQDRERRWRGEH